MLSEQRLRARPRPPWHGLSKTLANVEQQATVLLSQANAQVQAAQQALLDEQQKREMAAENERLKKGIAEQHDTFAKLVREQAEIDKLRQFVVGYRSAI